MDKVYIITKGDDEGSTSIHQNCCYNSKDLAREDALKLFEKEKESFSQRMSELKKRYGNVPTIYLNKDGSEKEWKEEKENYFTNGFDFIEISELPVK